MKKVLLFAPMSSVHERFNIANIQALREMNCEIHLLANFSCDEHAAEYREQCIREGISVHDMDFSRHSLKNNFHFVKQIKQLLRTERFDIVHAHTETGGILLRLAMGAYKDSKYYYTAHGMSFYKGSSLKSQMIYKPIESFICKKMDCNIAINGEEFEFLEKWEKEAAHFTHGAGVDVKSITTAVVDIEKKKRELGIPNDKKLVLSVGELDDNKNHKVILQAISRMNEVERPYLLICGEGGKRAELRSLAESFGYDKSLFMPGYRYDMPEIFHIADLFVFPSYHEGLSFALMQAMAAKLPVICSKIRGNVDLIEDGAGGFLLAPDDADSFGNRINELLNDKEKSARFGENNSNKVQLFEINNVKDELKTLYNLF